METAGSIVFYAFCSSTLLLMNKVTLSYIPAPASVFSLQLAVAVVVLATSRACSICEVDGLSIAKLRHFLPYTAAFVLCIYANGKTIEHSNVETVIIFRALSPLIVSVLDYYILGRELPNLRSFVAMVAILTGTAGYVVTDRDFELNGVKAYGWVMVYLGATVVEMTYGKYLLSQIGFATPIWGSVFYCNITGLLPMIALAAGSGEIATLRALQVTHYGIFMLACTSIAGIAIGWASWSCRDKLSATSFTLVGVTCKLFSVLLNATMWDKHASRIGTLWLVLCLLAGCAYQQAPEQEHGVEDTESEAPKDKPMPVEHVLKLVILGDVGVGKSTLLHGFVKGKGATLKCNGVLMPVKTASKIVQVAGRSVKLQIWNTSGLEKDRHTSLLRAYCRGAAGAILLYDVTNRRSFESLKKWLGVARKLAPVPTSVLAVGNKCDHTDERAVTFLEASCSVQESCIPLLETSATTGEGVEEAFLKVAQMILNKIDDGLVEPKFTASDVSGRTLLSTRWYWF